MEVLYLLIPLSLVLVGVIVWIFLWAIRSGQFDDMEGPAHRILMDDDDIPDEQPAQDDEREKTGRMKAATMQYIYCRSAPRARIGLGYSRTRCAPTGIFSNTCAQNYQCAKTC